MVNDRHWSLCWENSRIRSDCREWRFQGRKRKHFGVESCRVYCYYVMEWGILCYRGKFLFYLLNCSFSNFEPSLEKYTEVSSLLGWTLNFLVESPSPMDFQTIRNLHPKREIFLNLIGIRVLHCISTDKEMFTGSLRQGCTTTTNHTRNVIEF